MSHRKAKRTPSNRRHFLKTVTATATLGLLHHARSGEDHKPGTFKMAVVSDLHHEDQRCDAWFDRLFQEIARLDVAFCLVLGDLANSGKPASLAAIKRLAAKSKVEIFPVPGNHDCDLRDDTSLYQAAYPESLNYTFTHQNWQFVAFDTTDGKEWGNVSTPPERLEWLSEAVSNLAPDKPTVLFTHFPLHPSVNNALLNGESILERFASSQLKLVLSGHHHGETKNESGDCVLFTQPCVSRVQGNHDGTTDKGYCLFTLYPNGSWDRLFQVFG